MEGDDDDDELTELQTQWERLVADADSLDASLEDPPARSARSAPQHRLATSGGFWSLSMLKPRGQARGCSVICRLHVNVGDARGRCKKSLNMGPHLSEAEVQTRLKRWLLHGAELTLRSQGATSRTEHLHVDARRDCAEGLAGTALDERLAAVEAELQEMSLL